VSSISAPRSYLLIVLVGLLAACLGLAPQPHAARQALEAARQALEVGASAAAAARLERAAAYFPWRADLWAEAGRSALAAGDLAAASAHLERAAALGGISEADLLTLADAQQAAGNQEAASALWDQLLQSGSLSAEVYARRAALAYAQEQYLAAAADLQALVLLRPADTASLYRLGLIMAALEPNTAQVYLTQVAAGDFSQASFAQDLSRRISTARLFDEPAYTFMVTGQALASQAEWGLALQAFLQATQIRPDYAEAWAYLGEARQRQPAGSPQAGSGLDEMRQSLALDPDCLAAHIFLGLYYERRGDYPQALSWVQAAAALDPGNPDLQVGMGDLLALQGELPEAQAAYEQAIALAPQNAAYPIALAQFALEQQIQVRTLALPAARQAVLLAPQDPAALDVMGHTLVLLGDFFNAERFLQRALQNDPNYAPAHLHLGAAYLFMEQPALARAHLDLARALDPNGPTARDAQRLLTYYFP